MNNRNFDIIVVGAGHAGCEAGLAAARLGKQVAVFTLYLDNVAMMSCNPSIGGPGKSNLVTEIDILGGEMGRHTDKYHLQLKTLNESKGPAAHITRGQADKFVYRKQMKKVMENTENLHLIQQGVDELIVDNGEIRGIKTNLGIEYHAKCVILCTGTFLRGKIVIGDIAYSAGRQGEMSADNLSESLISHGIVIDRYQTATPPRIDRRTIDFSKMHEMKGEESPEYFSIFTHIHNEKPYSTWLTYTTPETIEVTKKLLKYSPIVSGIIETHGPRHCPSLDRKVLNFPDKTNHQVFIEMESADSQEMYVNGLTTAMPPFAQEEMLHTIIGLENAKIMRYGYAVEYDYVPAYQMYSSLENKKIKGLYCAGQINGTSGYEEAAAQGFMAGVNAARSIDGKEPIIIDRSEGYIGVLIDDLIHKKTMEPYRVLPSRAEYRLTLRFDNAFMRLADKVAEIGIRPQEEIEYIYKAKSQVEEALEELENKPYEELCRIVDSRDYPDFVKKEIKIMAKYGIFIEREKKQIEKFKKLESMKIPEGLDYANIRGISNIAKTGLIAIDPRSIGEASRISGVTGNDLTILISHIDKNKK